MGNVRALYTRPTPVAPSPDSPSAPDRDQLVQAALTHADSLYRLARSLCGSVPAAEDLMQDTLTRAISAHDQFERGTNLRAWLCRIMRNTFIDGKRRGRANPVKVDIDDVGDESLSAAKDEPLRGDAELETLRSVVAADIERALGRLSVDARAVIMLDAEGFTETELAVVLGCATGTVKSRLARARALLRAELSDYGRP